MTEYKPPFRAYQPIIVKDMYNSATEKKTDVFGVFIRELGHLEYKGKYLVRVGGVELIVDPSRVTAGHSDNNVG